MSRGPEALVKTQTSGGHADPGSPGSSADHEPTGTLDRYALLERLGEGGMGVVYRAYDPKLQREVALKLVRHEDPVARSRIVREAQAMAQLSHPNVVAVYDVLETHAGSMLVMQLIEGGTLRDRLAKGLPNDVIVSLFVKAGRGLAAAHARGLVHRDFKPENVLISSEAVVKVTDFGLARTRGDLDEPGESVPAGVVAADAVTAAGRVMGTTVYMSPEQQRGEVGPKGDQFAFCVSLWEALNGSRPYDRPTQREVYDAKMAGPPSWEAGSVPRRVVRCVERGLAPKPEDRWPSMDALLDELEGRPRRRVGLLLTAGAVLAAISVGVWTSSRPAAQSPCPDPTEEIAETWNEARRDQLREAVNRSGLPYAAQTADAVVGAIESYVEQWTDAHRSACEATRVHKTQSEGLLDRAMGCLDQSRQGLESVVTQLTAAEEATLLSQEQLFETLLPPGRCTDRRRLETNDIYAPEESQQHASVLAEIPVIRGEAVAGRLGSAVESSAALLRELPEDANPHVRWNVLQLHGEVLGMAGRFEPGLETLQDALFVATSLDDELKLFESSLATASLRFRFEPGSSAGFESLALARGIAERRGDKHLWERYAQVAVAGHAGLGHAGRARELSQELLRRAEANFPSDSIEVARARHAVATQSDDPRNALALVAKVAGPYERYYGENHPKVAALYSEMSTSYYGTGQTAKAIAYQERTLAIRQALFPQGDRSIAASMVNLASYYNTLDNGERSSDYATQALRVLEHIGLGEDNIYGAAARNNRANAWVLLGDRARAGEDFKRAWEIRTGLYSSTHPSVAKASVRWGMFLLDSELEEERQRGADLVREGWEVLQQVDATFYVRWDIGLSMARMYWETSQLTPPAARLRRVSRLCAEADRFAEYSGDPELRSQVFALYANEIRAAEETLPRGRDHG